MKRLIMIATLAVATVFIGCSNECGCGASKMPVTRDMFPADADYMGFIVVADHITPLSKKLEEAFPNAQNDGIAQMETLSKQHPVLIRLFNALEILPKKGEQANPNMLQGMTIAIKVNSPEKRIGVIATMTGDFKAQNFVETIYTEVTEALKKDTEVAKQITLQQVANGLTGSISIPESGSDQSQKFSLLVEGKTLTLRIGDYMEMFAPIAVDSAFATKIPKDRSRSAGYGLVPDLQRTLTNNDILPLNPQIPTDANTKALTSLTKADISLTEEADFAIYTLRIVAGSISDAKMLFSQFTGLKGMGTMAIASQKQKEAPLILAMLNAITLTQPEGSTDIIASLKYDIPLIKAVMDYTKLMNKEENQAKDLN